MLDLIIIIAFIIYSISNGFRNRSKASRNLEEYFLAGRSIKGWRAGFSLAATQFAADTPLLVTGLIATGGIWKGERLISDTDLLRAHGAGNGCFVGGVGEGIMLSFAKVTTSGIDLSSIPLHLLVGNRPQPK